MTQEGWRQQRSKGYCKHVFFGIGVQTLSYGKADLYAHPLAASEDVNVRAQSLAVGVFSSHRKSLGCPVQLPGSVPAPGSGTR